MAEHASEQQTNVSWFYQKREKMEPGAKSVPVQEVKMDPKQRVMLKATPNEGLEKLILTVTLIIFDVIMTYLAFWTAYLVRYSSDLPFFQEGTQPEVNYFDFSLLLVLIWVGIFAAVGLYSHKNLLGGTREYELIFQATGIGQFIIIFSGFLFPDNLILARGWVILTWVTSYGYLTIERFCVRRLIYWLRLQGYFRRNTLIIGANSEACLIAEQLSGHKTAGLNVVGFARCGLSSHEQIDGLSCLGTIGDLEKIIERNNIGVVILIGSALPQEQIIAIFEKFVTASNVELRLSSGLYEIITTGMQVIEDGMVPLVVVNKVRLTGTNRLLKTIFDYSIAFVAGIFLLPLFLVIALVIMFDSPGPVIYLRQVMGVNGRKFFAYKFRTMRVDGDKILESQPALLEEYKKNFKLKIDPRITKAGRFLRKTSLDELPQIFNVLRNEMSLVGPRMICPDELEKYDRWKINLLTIKPGITGLWQVRGRSDVSYDERVRLDMFYIRNWTLWLDLQIILQTIPTIIFKKGAY
jgi:exopolysaccharide biosynthesis polyprenyl glycosylphosphotransferase